MNSKLKSIIKILGIIAVCCLGLYIAILGAAVLLFPVHWNYVESQTNRGEASIEEKQKFEEYCEYFNVVKDFVIEEYSENNLNAGLEVNKTECFFIDAENGNIRRSVSLENLEYNWLSVSSEIKEGINKASNYFGSGLSRIYVSENRVTFDCGEDMIVFVKDGTTPTYASEPYNPDDPDAIEESFRLYKLRDNWYYISLL